VGGVMLLIQINTPAANTWHKVNVKPIGWSDERPQNGALEMAFLLLSIENIAALSLPSLWSSRRCSGSSSAGSDSRWFSGRQMAGLAY
jgi:hypothetical protein